MHARQSLWTAQQGWTGRSDGPADLLLAFGGTRAITNKNLWDELSSRHPGAIVLGCTTGGEIHGAAALTGFYSYGEGSPHAATRCAELHNQTMTITVFGERAGA